MPYLQTHKKPARWQAFHDERTTQNQAWGDVMEELVFGNLRYGAHGALLEAFAACDASVFVHNFGNAARNFENLLRACINADAATNAFVGIDNGMGHT